MLTDNQRKKIKPVSVFLFLILCQSLGFPQVSDVQKTLRIKLWAPMDENPGAEISSSDTNYGTSIRSLKKTAPFLLTGMIYGWKFEYTPSDKTRNVAEYFSLEPVAEISEILSANENTIKSRLKRARELLKGDFLNEHI